MWVTQSYLSTVEPDAKVFIYYLFEDYNRNQKQFTRQVQRAMERMGEVHGTTVSLLMPNPNYADRIESEMRQIVPLWELIHGALPALLISTKPMKELDMNTEHCFCIPFNETRAHAVAETISKARRLTYETLNYSFSEQEQLPQSSWGKRIGESIELKPGIFGFRLDLIKLFSK